MAQMQNGSVFGIFWDRMAQKRQQSIYSSVMSSLPRNASSEKRSIRIRKRQQLKLLREKENGFVLDCLNQAKAHVQSYKSINDKFLKYCVIRLKPSPSKSKRSPNKIRGTVKLPKTAKSACEDQERNNHMRFQQMLQQQRQKLLAGQGRKWCTVAEQEQE